MKTYIIITKENSKQIGNIAKEKYSVSIYVGKNGRMFGCAGAKELNKRLAEIANVNYSISTMLFASDDAAKQYCNETAEYLNA